MRQACKYRQSEASEGKVKDGQQRRKGMNNKENKKEDERTEQGGLPFPPQAWHETGSPCKSPILVRQSLTSSAICTPRALSMPQCALPPMVQKLSYKPQLQE